MKIPTRKITFVAAVAAVYAALTVALAFIGYGPIQFRIAEALCILPFFFPASAWGLFIGCAIANLISAYGPVDIVFGSLATLVSSLGVMYMGKTGRDSIGAKIIACLMPVIANGIVVGAIISWAETPAEAWANGIPDVFWALFAVNGSQVALGELAVLFIIGLPLMIYLPKMKFFTQFQEKYRF